MNSPSGVKASGPLISRTISALPIAGTRCTAPSISGAKRSQSGGRSLWLKSAGMPSSPQGAGARARTRLPPGRRPPRGSRRDGPGPAASGSPGARRRWAWSRGTGGAIGTRGIVTPAIRPISGAYIPPAFTTTSVRIVPAVVSTSWTRPSRTPMRRTRVPVRIVAPRFRAPSASAIARPLGSRWPSVGRYTAPRTPSRRHHREKPLRLRRPDLLQGKPEGLGPARLTAVLEDPLGRARQPEAAGLLPARVAAGLGGEPPVALDAPHHQPREGNGRAELADQARGVEGRAAGQLGALDQHDVAPALGREVVRDARAAHAAPYDDCPRVLGHGARL